MVDLDTSEAAWADSWQASWDRQQEGHMPDRERRLEALLDVVEAVAGPAPYVLDLASGTGTISRRLLARYPAARTVAVDVDPALRTIAAATFAGDDRVRLVRADLRDPAWRDNLPDGPFDAVLTATALHWLPEDVLRRLYRDLYDVVKPGGAVANADEMPLLDLPRLGSALDEIAARRQDEMRIDGRPDWQGWWEEVAADPMLADAATARLELFGGNHSATFIPSARWHIDALAEAGFREVGVTWRSGPGAVVAAVR